MNAIETNEMFKKIMLYFTQVVKKLYDLGYNIDNSYKIFNFNEYNKMFNLITYIIDEFSPYLDKDANNKYLDFIISQAGVKDINEFITCRHKNFVLPYIKTFGNIYIDYIYVLKTYDRAIESGIPVLENHSTFLKCLKRINLYLPPEIINRILDFNPYTCEKFISHTLSHMLCGFFFCSRIRKIAYDTNNIIHKEMKEILEIPFDTPYDPEIDADINKLFEYIKQYDVLEGL